MIELLTHPLSTFGRRVEIALNEKQVEYKLTVVDMPAREHRGEAFRALNPYGRVPVLRHDGFVLYESAAILCYLDAIHPEPPLMPADAQNRALVDMHLRLCDLEFATKATRMIFPRRFMPPERWDREAQAATKAELERHLAIVAQQLGEADYLVAGRFTLADIAYLPFLEFLPLLEIEPAAAVARWAERLSERPSSVKTRPAH
jgi:glutathione S-transferase